MYQMYDPVFVKLIENGVSLKEIEKRLHPSSGLSRDAEILAHAGFKNYSVSGFLGIDEDLLSLIHEDWKVVLDYGTTHHDIANALSLAIKSLKLPNSDYKIEHNYCSGGIQPCPWECEEPYEYGNGLILIYHKSLTRDEIIAAQYAILFDEEIHDMHRARLDSAALITFNAILADFTKLSNKLAPVTELHPHLIEKHYFFQGKKSVYRSNPEVLIKALNLSRL